MGKKATGKLLRKLKTGPKDVKGGKGKRAKSETLSTKLNRQQKRMKQGLKRKRDGKPEDSSDDESADEARKNQKNWIADPTLAVGEQEQFDPETASKKVTKSKKNPKSKNTVLDVDSFLAGGFMNEVDSDDEEDESNDKAASVEDENNDDSENEENSDQEASDAGEDKEIVSEDEEESASEDEDEMEQHKKDLEALMERDPEFYKHLQRNAKDLLSFGEGETKEESSDEEKQTNKSKKASAGITRPVLNGAALRQICKDALVRKTDKGMRSLLGAFRSGCHVADPEGVEEDESVGMGQRYDIVSSAVYQKLMTITLRDMHKLFAYKLNLKVNKSNEEETGSEANELSMSSPTTSKTWKRYQPNVKSFVVNLIHLLTQSTEPSMLRFLLQSSRFYTSYVVAMPKIQAKKYLKVLLNHWGSSEDSGVRLAAFLRIRQLAMIYVKNGDETMLEHILKSSYLCFVKGAKFSTERTIERISTQARCIVELFGLQLNISYRLGFVYIRQLALHLKGAISSKTIEGVKGVYSWQYVHCLRVWSSILCAYPGVSIKDANAGNGRSASDPQSDEELRPLVYPLVQVIIGTIRLVPTPRNFPVRLHCLNMLVPLARASRMYVPVAPLALEILQQADLYRNKPVPSTAKPPEFDHILRLNESILPTNPCLDALVTRTIYVLKEHLDCHRFSIGFPELVFPTSVALRSCAKKCRVTRWRSQMRSLIDSINKWSQEVQQKRSNVEFAPSDVKRMNHFMSQEEDAYNLVREKQGAGLNNDVVSMIAEKSKVVEQDSESEDDGDISMDGTDTEDDVSEGDQVEEVKQSSKSNNKKALKSRKNNVKSVNEQESGEDVVQDMQLSDLSDSDDE